jgi:transcriptional regulator with XRE-family HTH domain
MRDLGFNYRYFQKIEAGEMNPTLGTLLKLAKVFSCSLSDLLD